MTELVDFLRARLDEDERVALSIDEWDGDQLTGIEVYTESNYPCGQVLGIGRKRVLDDIASKRQIIDECVPELDGMSPHQVGYGSIVRILALPYADHEDYREGWKP